MTDRDAEIDAELMEAIEAYDEENKKQQWKAKADFMRLIESSLLKLNDFSGLNALEKVALKTAIVDKRMDFGTDVESWQTNLKSAMDNVATKPGSDPGFSNQSDLIQSNLTTDLGSGG